MHNKQSPYAITVTKDENIYLCQCGKTAKPPYCDGSHKSTDGIKPFIYTANKDEEIYVCGCQKSTDMPWCDGSHKK